MSSSDEPKLLRSDDPAFTKLPNHNLTGKDLNEDDALILKMGYHPELRRGFSAFMSFSLCFTAVAVISSISGLFINSLSTGGPAVLIWSWMLGSILTIMIAANLGEICSTYPSAGSVYHWAGCLAPGEVRSVCFQPWCWIEMLGSIYRFLPFYSMSLLTVPSSSFIHSTDHYSVTLRDGSVSAVDC